MKTEPILNVAAVTALIGSIIGLVTAFGIDISDNQQKAILAVIIAAAPFVIWYQARKSTVPVDKANDHIEAALKTPATTHSDGFLFEKGS